MKLRKYDLGDLDDCIEMYLDFVNTLEHGDDDAWTENAVAERLKGILESPVFEGWVLEEGGRIAGFMLGVAFFNRTGKSYDVLELFSATGRDVRGTAKQMLELAGPVLKSEGYVRIGSLSHDLWDPSFFNSAGFKENKEVRLFEKNI